MKIMKNATGNFKKVKKVQKYTDHFADLMKHETLSFHRYDDIFQSHSLKWLAYLKKKQADWCISVFEYLLQDVIGAI